jgi:imidazole glycerol-phosphate synthase subunit HisH
VIALIDYGAGNLTSVRKALAALGADVATPATPTALAQARGIIVPGVGHFAATSAIDGAWRTAIEDAHERGASLFGICLGMQWLFEGSEEAPDVPGLGAFEGHCRRLQAGPDAGPVWKVPHVGWNSLSLPRPAPLMDGIAEGSQVYFTHSFVAPIVEETAAVTTHGTPFTAAVARGRTAGVQFHPEKSGDVGLRILRNWLHAL